MTPPATPPPPPTRDRPRGDPKPPARRGTPTAERLSLTFECMGYSLRYTGRK